MYRKLECYTYILEKLDNYFPNYLETIEQTPAAYQVTAGLNKAILKVFLNAVLSRHYLMILAK